ncbi:MAG: hypothetical protein Q8R02_15930 [Hyphomonadaceae bacterium]|nr:hypothetical protein [Hyphomonadaceae bacterium]
MPHPRSSDEVRAVDMEIGGDDDMPGISQELTTDDIDDIAFDPNLTVGERTERLMELRDEFYQRRSGDYMGDMEGIRARLSDRLASLGNPQESETVLESTGMYPGDRSDDDDPADHIDDEEPEEDGGP